MPLAPMPRSIRGKADPNRHLAEWIDSGEAQLVAMARRFARWSQAAAEHRHRRALDRSAPQQIERPVPGVAHPGSMGAQPPGAGLDHQVAHHRQLVDMLMPVDEIGRAAEMGLEGIDLAR